MYASKSNVVTERFIHKLSIRTGDLQYLCTFNESMLEVNEPWQLIEASTTFRTHLQILANYIV